MRKVSIFLSGVALGAIALVALQEMKVSANANAAASDTYRRLTLFGDVFDKIRSDHVDKPDEAKLIESAINGMVTSLDPHSAFLDQKSNQEMQQQTRGEFGGLGIEVTQEEGVIKVVSPIDGTPAAAAGIQTGDYITKVNGESMVGLTLDQAVDKMRGAVKSDVRLNFKNASGTSLGSGQAVYSGSGNWEKIKLTRTAPAGTVICDVDVFNDTAGAGTYMLYSDFQLEEGTSATAYSETMGVYYPDYPRTDGIVTPIGTPNVPLTLTVDKTQALPGDTLTYTITYRNTGNDAAANVVVSCPIPANTTYVTGSGGTYDSAARTVRWTIPTLATGGSGTLTFKVTVD